MLKKLFKTLVLVSPSRKSWFWRWCYNFLSKRYPGSDWTFTNYGYVPSDSVSPLFLEEKDRANFPNIMLYRELIGIVRLVDAIVLEVGCGRGGGTEYIARTFNPRLIEGIDLSEQNIAFCQRTHKSSNLSFKVGDAEALPYKDASLDVVINLESSHCYGSREVFFCEVIRVLKPGGVFLWGDLCPQNSLAGLEAQLKEVGFSCLDSETITHNVLWSLESDGNNLQQRILPTLPRILRPYFQVFAGTPGTEIYESLKNGSLTYVLKTLRKAEYSWEWDAS